ncbi:YggS family pyridoxal phosphate-dependent enzyme [Dokdonia sinensis]|uniref:Pyridoxal phosphate homeostasis protein n=1 Tax=Dokdonia sinensis TaxID=2479847 RepID=A0A3M0FTW7_9FLAO|nr:YggS family pyridoxal phosphate-dependent enzyme [Dokdonia sinensis]RMB56124.1 YggS family pyridoxal phosphate-dependent enzyme [Dokdonia sinensis]
MSIKENILQFRQEIPEHVTLVAVSKTKPNADLMEAYEAGQRIFGENKIQEMTEKWEQLPKDIEWHMIGHVQTNKVKYMAPFVSLVHAVDRIKLLKEINKQAKKENRVIDVLIQIKIAREDSKFGMPVEEANQLFEQGKLSAYPNVNVKGLMGMATFTDDTDQVAAEFELLEGIFLRFRESANLSILSTGMSGDYKIAIENGSTMIRVGSAIFGARN